MRPKRPRPTYVTAMVLLNALTAIVAVEATLDDAAGPWLTISFPSDRFYSSEMRLRVSMNLRSGGRQSGNRRAPIASETTNGRVARDSPTAPLRPDASGDLPVYDNAVFLPERLGDRY